MDLSINLLNQTHKYLALNGLYAHLVQADAFALPFKDDTFALAHSHELSVFNHGNIDERVNVLSEQKRVCKTGGTIITVLPQRDQEGFYRLESNKCGTYSALQASVLSARCIHRENCTGLVPSIYYRSCIRLSQNLLVGGS